MKSDDPRSGRRRRQLWLGLAAALLAAIALWRWREEPPAPVAAPPPPAPAAVEIPPPPPLPPEDELPEPVRRYLAGTVYPPSSGRLGPEQEDLLAPNSRHERPRTLRDTLGDPAGAISYRLGSDRYDVTGAERVEAWLEAERGGEPVALRILEASLVREGRAGPEGEPIRVLFRAAGPRWTSTLPLDALGDHHGPFSLQVRFEYAPGASESDLLRFFHTPEERIPARFTGRFHDYVRDGSLRVEVGLEVDTPGFYRLDANLHSRDGRPLAFASFKGELDAGDAMVPLEVFGRVLRDVGVAGPYEMSELRGYRFRDGEYPDRETIPAYRDSWTTGAYDLAEFSPDEWDSEHKRRMVELMLQDVARGIGPDLPDLPGSPR